jgi:BON domain-containing protein/PRC-barrel domain protein
MRSLPVIVATVAIAALPLGSAVAQQPLPKPPVPSAAAKSQVRPIQKPEELGLWKGSKIIGAKVEDANGKNIGKIEDVMVDATGRVPYAVLSFGGLLGIGDKLYAIPWTVMNFDHDKNELKRVVLDVTKESLERAPSFSSDKWPDPNDRDWRARTGNYWNDSSVTAAVKSKLAAEKLNTLTKVDVDTHQGVVELKGTVDSERTKSRATELTRQVKGVRQVVNNLKVQG